MRDLGVLEVVRLQHRADGIAVGLEVGRVVGETDIDGAGEGLDMDRLEAVTGRIESIGPFGQRR